MIYFNYVHVLYITTMYDTDTYIDGDHIIGFNPLVDILGPTRLAFFKLYGRHARTVTVTRAGSDRMISGCRDTRYIQYITIRSSSYTSSYVVRAITMILMRILHNYDNEHDHSCSAWFIGWLTSRFWFDILSFIQLFFLLSARVTLHNYSIMIS